MKISARNVMNGTVKKIIVGTVNAEVTVEIAPGIEMTAMITKTACENLGLAEGKSANLVVKASDVMLAVD